MTVEAEVKLSRVSIYYFGRIGGDWKLGFPIQGLLSDRETVVAREISSFAHRLGVNTVLAPNVSKASGKIARAEDLPIKVKGDDPPIIRRGLVEKNGGLHLEFHDGAILGANEAFYVATGDCPTVIVTSNDSKKVIATHGGRDCLIDQEMILSGKPSRKNFSVVDSIMESFEGKNPERISVFIALGIGAEHFHHKWSDPKWGEVNRTLTNYVIQNFGRRCIEGEREKGCINLPKIIFRQFEKYGVGELEWDGCDTYSDTENGEHLWHSHRRDKGPARNGILVVPT